LSCCYVLKRCGPATFNGPCRQGRPSQQQRAVRLSVSESEKKVSTDRLMESRRSAPTNLTNYRDASALSARTVVLIASMCFTLSCHFLHHHRPPLDAQNKRPVCDDYTAPRPAGFGLRQPGSSVTVLQSRTKSKSDGTDV